MERYDIQRGFELHDTLYYRDGRTVVLPVVRNRIQATFGKLLAALTSGLALATAINYMEVGTGDPGWDATPPPPDPGTAQTALLNPVSRVTLTWAYLNPDNTVSGSPTARVGGTASYGIGVAAGFTLREVALWGGAGSTGTLGTGTLVNVVRTAPIAKPSGGGDFALTRQMVIQF